jgi:hypothetical protein
MVAGAFIWLNPTALHPSSPRPTYFSSVFNSVLTQPPRSFHSTRYTTASEGSILEEVAISDIAKHSFYSESGKHSCSIALELDTILPSALRVCSSILKTVTGSCILECGEELLSQ